MVEQRQPGAEDGQGYPTLLGDLGRGPLPLEEQRDLCLSRLGGEPAWARLPSAISKVRRPDFVTCARCGRKRGFLGQLFAASETSHCRVLYLFVCPTPTCGADERGWRVLRSVAAEGRGDRAGDAFVGAQGADSGIDAAGNWEADWAVGSDGNSWEAGDGGGEAAANPTVNAEIERLLLHHACGGAKAVSTGSRQPVQDEAEASTWLGECGPLSSGAAWPCFALTIYAEPPAPPKSGPHELELLERYRRDLGHQEEAEEAPASVEEAVTRGNESRAHAADDDEGVADDRWILVGWPAAVDLQATEEASNPAWPPPCGRCGARRVFEVQLLPTLLYTVRARCPEHFPDAEIEWGTVCVYTCSADCSADDEPCEEFVVVQPAI
eukprot:CAMPEP_0179209644 /NCGR_PEP_ID=MMETSP0796-20121207/104557_1 /TAXON_ID=73915 /ORGANISM="Pyrodinium bahamense, Strain pbaha01" /LENGTH=380 /DNA_ID=CAMNT_0020914603 /DNA_START=60 /DNA_END=1203 /DNA_ORIENTATION=-